MTSIQRILLSTVSASVLAFSAVPAFAQADGGSELGSGDDIVVTARRSEERLQDVPISITVFTQTQVQNNNIVSAGDLATYTPSLTANSRYGPESTSFAIRGFVQEGPTSPSVAVYFADVVAPRANGSTAAGNGAGVGSLFDLQNIQVLKGPQGTLFGRNTTGGAILLVPQKPTSKLEGYVEGSLGNYDLRRVQAVLNAPLGDNVRLRLGVDRQKRDGYIRNISGVGPDDFNDTNYIALRASLVIDVTPDIENYTIATFSNSDTNGYYPKVFYAVPGFYRSANIAAQIARTSGGYYDVENARPYGFQKIRQWGVINTTTFLASDTVTLKNILSYAEFEQKQAVSINGDNGYDPTTTPPSSNYAISTEPAPGSHNASQSTFTEEFQIQGRLGDGRLNYQGGIYYEKSEPLDRFQSSYSALFLRCVDITALQCTDVRGQLTPNGAGGNLQGRIGNVSIPRSRYHFRNFGAYAQATYKFSEKLSLTGGIRYTADKTFGTGAAQRVLFPAPNTPVFSCALPVPLVQGGTSAQVQADPMRCAYNRRATSKKPTWLIDIDYKPTEDVLIYAKYSRGYRQGSINVSSYGLETWGPEKVNAYEVGTKAAFSRSLRGTFNFAAFYNQLSDQQLQLGTVACQPADLISRPVQCPFAATPASGIANAGKSTIKGIEIDAAVSPLTGLRLAVGYAYLKTKLDSATIPTPPPGFTALVGPTVGGPLPLTPKHKLTLSGNYTIPIDDSLGVITLGATYSYQSSQIGNTSSLVRFQRLPSQNNLNLNLNWNEIAGSPIDVQLFATNVTKEKFRLNTVGGANSFGFESEILNPPRMYGVRVRYSFGT